MKEILEIETGRVDRIILDINIPRNWNGEKVIIGCHGFDSSKNSSDIITFKESLEENGIAFATFNLPYHDERRIYSEDFTIENCIQDINNVEKVLLNKFPHSKIGIYASSFGAYLILLKLKKMQFKYFAIILKSPAIKMDEIIRSCLINDDIDTFRKVGYTMRYRKSPMKLYYKFYEELLENKILTKGVYDEEILIFHGTNDDTAPFDDVKEFVNRNKKMILYPVIDESHKMSYKNMKKIFEVAMNYIKREG